MIKMENCKDSIRTLGIHMNPEKNWSKQFIIIVNKMRTAVVKLMNTTIMVLLIYIYFNAYLMKSVYFGYRIIELEEEQEQILQNIYEKLFLKKNHN